MNLQALPRITPEMAGVDSQTLMSLLQALEMSGSEPHGIVMMRDGKVFAEGWWAPYAPGVVHAGQSLTKTMTGAAYGAAELMGILRLDEHVLDVFPEYVGLTNGPYWDELKVYHLLTMSTGMESQYPVNAADWMRGFFTMPIVNKPGTAFYYNSAACSLVGACIRKRSGLSLLDFLSRHVFADIGIRADRIKWLCHPDGQENGSGGILSTTEDNARLMQLYLQGGIWNGKQVISPHWAHMAVQLQNGHIMRGNADAALGYGGMMWIRENCFYADGGMGQYAIGFPDKGLVIAVHETLSTPEGLHKISDAIFHFDRFVSDTPLPANAHAHAALSNRLARLSIPAYPTTSFRGVLPTGVKLLLRKGEVPLFADDFKIFSDSYRERVEGFSFDRDGDVIVLRVFSETGIKALCASVDGRRWYHHVEGNNLATELSLTACWQNDHTLVFEFRWIESCRLRTVAFCFDDTGVDITTMLMRVGGFDEEPWTARADMEKG